MNRSAGAFTCTTSAIGRRAVGSVLRGHRWGVARIALTAFLGGALEALFLVTITRCAFAVAEQADQVRLVSGLSVSTSSALLFSLMLIAIRLALAVYAGWQSARVSTRAVAAIRNRLSGAFLDSSWEVQQAQRSGSLQALLTGYSGSASTLMGNFTQGIVAAGNLAALLCAAVVVDPVGALFLVVSVGLLGVLLRPLRRVVRRRAREVTAVGMDYATSVNEISDLGLELHVFHVQEKARERVGDHVERVRRVDAGLQIAAGLSTPLYSGLAYLVIVVMLAFVAASELTSLTSLGAAMLVMLRSLSYGQAAQGAVLGVSGAVPAIEELQDRLAVFHEARRADGGQPIGRLGAVSMAEVSFAYPSGPPVLRDVSFVIPPHEIVGIVGPSGAGKSTLVQLLLGLREPTHGRVLAGGRDITLLDRREWARKVTFVPQATHLIAGTISENIRFFRDGVSQEDVERAARLAHLHQDIEAFPDGYERQVGERGGHLSGGQQQRLCIARALVEHPDLLILDEPTSALDVRSEHLVRNTLLKLKGSMTVIVIAHRLSTLNICDRIMVINDSKLQEFDTPGRLAESSEFYREALALSGMR